MNAPRSGWQAFADRAAEYDAWYDEHRAVYEGEVAALRALLPPFRRGVELGAGSGRFAAPLGLLACEPALPAARLARRTGTPVIVARGEQVPLRSAAFDCVLLAHALEFVAEPAAVLREARRLLAPGGTLVLALCACRPPEEKPGRFRASACTFTDAALAALLSATGFAVDEQRAYRIASDTVVPAADGEWRLRRCRRD